MERDAMSMTNENAYPIWLRQLVGEFDRWAALRRSMVRDMIRESVGTEKLPVRSEEDAKAIARERGKAARALDRELRRSPCKTRRAEKKRQERLARRWREHFRSSQETDDDNTPPTLADKITIVACLHDMMIDLDGGRARRKGWTRIVPDFDGVLQQITLATYISAETIVKHDEDRKDTGSCGLEDDWREVQEEVAAMEKKSADSDTGQQSEGDTPAEKTESQPASEVDAATMEPGADQQSKGTEQTASPAPPPPAKGQKPQRWSRPYRKEEVARALISSVDKLRKYTNRYPSSCWSLTRESHRFDLNDGLFRDLEPSRQ